MRERLREGWSVSRTAHYFGMKYQQVFQIAKRMVEKGELKHIPTGNDKELAFQEYHRIREQYIEVSERLDKLVEEQRVTSGCLLVYSFYLNTWADKLRNIGYVGSKEYKKTTAREIRIWVELLCEDYVKAKAFVEEQESLPFEDTQKQVLIRAGKLEKTVGDLMLESKQLRDQPAGDTGTA